MSSSSSSSSSVYSSLSKICSTGEGCGTERGAWRKAMLSLGRDNSRGSCQHPGSTQQRDQHVQRTCEKPATFQNMVLDPLSIAEALPQVENVTGSKLRDDPLLGCASATAWGPSASLGPAVCHRRNGVGGAFHFKQTLRSVSHGPHDCHKVRLHNAHQLRVWWP